MNGRKARRLRKLATKRSSVSNEYIELFPERETVANGRFVPAADAHAHEVLSRVETPELVTDPAEDTGPSTWADDHGLWHARLRQSGSPQKDVAAARKLILAELQARGPAGVAPKISITRGKVYSDGTVEYLERAV